MQLINPCEIIIAVGSPVRIKLNISDMEFKITIFYMI
jgi:hypothetical protein